MKIRKGCGRGTCLKSGSIASLYTHQVRVYGTYLPIVAPVPQMIAWDLRNNLGRYNINPVPYPSFIDPDRALPCRHVSRAGSHLRTGLQ